MKLQKILKLKTVANFPDEAFRKYVSENFDKDNDGVLSEKEVNDVREIWVSGNHDIKSLKGIEHFKNLEVLICSFTEITNLDISKNIALRYVDCLGTGITSLDLSNNKSLEKLDCSQTEIINLDISKNIALKYLRCNYTQIINLDLRKNTALEILDCYGIGITSLDVSKNTVLKDLSCFSTQITNLDLSNNTALEILDCSWTKITSLDISNNIALEAIYCEGTGITSLDVSKNKALWELFCYATEITSLNIGNNPNLDSIMKGDTIKELTIAGNSFDITKKLDIIDVTKIENMQGATISGNIVSGYSYNTPITFEYNCGRSAYGKEVLNVTLNIKKGNDLIENDWKVVPSIKGWTYGEKANAPVGSANHGEVIFTYSNSPTGKFESAVPTEDGIWYVKAVVEETESYLGLESEPIEFTIAPKSSEDIKIPEINEDINIDDLVITVGDKTLVNGVDYDITEKQEGNTVTVTITFKGNYTGTITKTYEVEDSGNNKPPIDDDNNDNDDNNGDDNNDNDNNGNDNDDSNNNSGNGGSNNNNNGNNNSSNGNNNSGSTGKDEVVVKPTLPQTGERNTLGLWGLVLTITGGAIAFITGKSSKTIRKEK